MMMMIAVVIALCAMVLGGCVTSSCVDGNRVYRDWANGGVSAVPDNRCRQ